MLQNLFFSSYFPVVFLRVSYPLRQYEVPLIELSKALMEQQYVISGYFIAMFLPRGPMAYLVSGS